MTDMDGAACKRNIPLELTAPSIQRLVRKGLDEPLTREEQSRLCECVAFHIDMLLEQCRIPRTPGKVVKLS